MTDFRSTRSFHVNTSIIVIQEAKKSIVDNHPEDFTKWLVKMPLDKLSKKNGDNLLVIFLTQITKYNRPKFIQLLFAGWERIYPREEDVPFYVILFTIYLVSIIILRFVVDNIKGITFLEVMESLMTYHYQEISTACQKVWDTFGPQKYGIVLILYKLAKQEQNPVIFNFLTGKIRQISPYVKIPSWVKDFRSNPLGDSIYQPPEDQYGIPKSNGPNEPLLPTYQETIFIPEEPIVQLPSSNNIVPLMLEGLKQSGSGEKEINRAKSKLISELVIMTKEEKMEMVKPVLFIKSCKSRGDDPLLSRIYGPANPSINPTVQEMLYGGERMFTSLIISDSPIFGDIAIDWFVGYCEMCNLGIRRRWHAVRSPNNSGGWTGCYCTWKCVRDELVTSDSFDGTIKANLLSMGLVNEMEKQIIKTGVQDRRDNGDILPDQDSTDLN